MLKKSLKAFKDLIFLKHKYDDNSYEVIKLKEIANLSSYKNIYFSMHYNDLFKDLLYELKYRNCKYVAKLIAHIIKKDVDHLIELEKPDYLIISPISKKRYNSRGFNQVSEIFKNLNLSVKMIEIKKTKETKKMSKFTNDYDRKLNLINVFDVSNLNLSNKKLLIIDDIITSGTTVKTIEKCLKDSYDNIDVKIYAISISSSILRS